MRAGRPRSQGMGIAAVCAMRMTVSREPTPSARGVGKPGCPTPPPAGGPGSHAGGGGTRVAPCPHPREGVGGQSPPRNNRMFIAAVCAMRMTVSREPTPSAREVGKPGCPTPPPAGGPGSHAGGGGTRVSPSPCPSAGRWRPHRRLKRAGATCCPFPRPLAGPCREAQYNLRR